MYSIVMMAAMTAAPESPEFFKNNNGGCYGDPYAGGCYGQPQGKGFLGCGLWNKFCCKGQGYGYGDPYAYGGCYGQPQGKGFLGCGLWNKFCCKGQGYGYDDGYGGCYGQPQGKGFLGCGLWNKFCCKGRGYGYGGYPADGGGYAGPVGYAYGGQDAGYSHGYAQGPAMGYDMPNYQAAAPASSPAQVVVKVAGDAKVYANGQLTDLNGTERVFATPEITAGRDFRYEIQVEAADGTKTSKQIVVRAGHQTVVDFNEKAASNVTVNLPANAKLTVDGINTPAADGKSSFVTPELTKGQPYTYSFQMEVEKDGKMEVVTQKVRFKAGEAVNVDFTEVATVSAK